MRELKFRQPIYNRGGKFNHFEYWGRLGPQDEYNEKCFKSPASTSTMVSKPDEQFICLRDKNGKEIYEGDFIKTNTGEIIEIQHYISWEGDGYILSGFAFDCISLDYNIPKPDCEIIGNIHKNPELLKGE